MPYNLIKSISLPDYVSKTAGLVANSIDPDNSAVFGLSLFRFVYDLLSTCIILFSDKKFLFFVVFFS